MFGNTFTHMHVCLPCGKEWECDCEWDVGEVSEATCSACLTRINAEQKRTQYAGIHMHSCPKCGCGWDCSNECGVMDGSLSKVICGLCMEYIVGITAPSVPVPTISAVIEHMPHMHICIINDHVWEHLDADCGFETMMEPEKMRQMECPVCFVFV